MEGFLSALPVTASSPLALVGYVVVVVCWFILGMRVNRNKNLLKNIEKLRPEDQLPALQSEMGVVSISGGVTPEQWIKIRIHRFVFVAIILVVVVLFCLALSAFFLAAENQRVKAIAEQVRIEQAKKEYLQQVSIDEQKKQKDEILSQLSSELRFLISLEAGQAPLPFLLKVVSGQSSLNDGQLVSQCVYLDRSVKKLLSEFSTKEQGELLVEYYPEYRALIHDLQRRRNLYLEILAIVRADNPAGAKRLQEIAEEYEGLHGSLQKYQEILHSLISHK